jgi:hypothetical protein
VVSRKIQPVQSGQHDMIGDRRTWRNLAQGRTIVQVDRGKIEGIARREF